MITKQIVEVVGLGFHTSELSRAVQFAAQKAKSLKQTVSISVNGSIVYTINKKGVLTNA